MKKLYQEKKTVLKEKLMRLEKKKKISLISAGTILVVMLTAMASPIGKPKEEKKFSPDSFEVALDSVVAKKPKDFFFNKKDEKDEKVGEVLNPFNEGDKKEEANPFEKLKKENLRPIKNSSKNVYNDDSIWEIEEDNSTVINKKINQEEEEEEDPFAFYESEDMSSKVSIKDETINGFKNLLEIETSSKQIVSQDNPYLRIRLLENFSFNGSIVPKNVYLMANATFSNNRAFFKLNSIQIDGKLLDVDMEIYDTYGNRGLEITSGKTTDVSREVNNEIENEYNTQVNRGAGIVRGLLTSRPKVVIENKILLLKINKIN